MTKQQFLDQIVFGWIKKDLENISKIENSSPIGHANLPLALLVILYMDSLGAYLLGKYKDLELNIGEYLKDFPNSSEYHAELLVDLFRNGLGHDYFARGGITRLSKRPAMLYSEGIGVILDADSLLQDFIESLSQFRERLSDEHFSSRFEESKKEMEKRYLKHELIIKSLPGFSSSLNSVSTLLASGASGTAIYSNNLTNQQSN